MVVLDAVALIALMKDEPAAERVSELLRGPTLMSSVNYAEVMDHLQRVARLPADDISLALAPVVNSSVTVRDCDARLAEKAAAVRAEYYVPKRRAIGLADSFAIATALDEQQALATSDPAIAEIMSHLSGDVVPLPDSCGRLPV